MTTVSAFIKRHALLTYYALTFAISWGAVLGMMGFTGIPTTKAQIEAMLPVAIIAMLLGPSASGLLLVGLVESKAGFHDLRSRLGRWRVDARWYAIALLLAPLLILAVLMALSLSSPVYLPGIFTREDNLARLLLGLVSAVVTGICEELGWTGFVTPRLRQRYSILATGIIIGVLWGIWHLVPMVIMPSRAYAAPFSPMVYIVVRTLSFLVGSLVAFRVLMVWVYDRTQSLLLLILMHTALTAANIIYEPEALGGISNFILDFVTAAALWTIVALLFMVTRKQRLRPNMPPATIGVSHLTLRYRLLRISLALLTGFIALTAIGGGVALLVGLEDNRFPLEWLRSTPFPDYTIPAFILAIGVGGSALVACLMLIMRHRMSLPVSVASGMIIMGYIVVEYLILQQEPPGPARIEVFYFGLGAVIVALAGTLRW